MIASTTLTWALLIMSFGDNTGQIQAMTTVDGFGSEEACQLAQQIAQTQLPEQVKPPLMLCVPVDAARPLPNMLKDLLLTE